MSMLLHSVYCATSSQEGFSVGRRRTARRQRPHKTGTGPAASGEVVAKGKAGPAESGLAFFKDRTMQTMNNVRQFPSQVVAPSPAVFVSPKLKPFAVSFRFAGQLHELNVLAFTSCDATCSAIDIFFDGSDEMPSGGLDIKVVPLNILPRAA